MFRYLARAVWVVVFSVFFTVISTEVSAEPLTCECHRKIPEDKDVSYARRCFEFVVVNKCANADINAVVKAFRDDKELLDAWQKDIEKKCEQENMKALCVDKNRYADVEARMKIRSCDCADSVTEDDLEGAAECLSFIDDKKNKCCPAEQKAECGAEEQRARLVRLLTKATTQLNEELDNLRKAILSTSTTKDERAKKVKELNEKLRLQAAIPDYVREREGAAIKGFEDYGRHFVSFNLGYEYVSMGDLFSSGNARLGFQVYRIWGKPTGRNAGFKLYGPHIFADVELTTSGEQRVQSDSGAQAKAEDALEFGIGLFAPFYREDVADKGTPLYDHIGLLFTAGGRKTDSVGDLDHRFYGGLRFSLSPQTYVDMLVGETESLVSPRLELRGQVAMPGFMSNTNFHVGAIGNFGTDEASTRAGADVIRIYVLWNVRFDEVQSLWKN